MVSISIAVMKSHVLPTGYMALEVELIVLTKALEINELLYQFRISILGVHTGQKVRTGHF